MQPLVCDLRVSVYLNLHLNLNMNPLPGGG
jgi:hypothetical protein